LGFELQKEVRETEYHDPNKNFELVKVPSEVRYDPFSGEGGRIFPYRGYQLPRYDWAPIVKLSRERFCPFCPETLEKVTPRFPEKLIPGGHLRVGEAVVIPNMFPCEPYAGVVVMTPEHYLPMTGIPKQVVTDSFKAGFEFLKAVQKYDRAITGSLNWNYMPHGGGSVIHPHLQAMAGPQPTSYHDAMLKASDRFYREKGGNLVSELVNAEKEKKERYLGRIGDLHWIVSFAPRGMADITVVFENRTILEDINDRDLDDFAVGIQSVLGYYDSINLSGFNAAVFPGRYDSKGYWIMARLVGRFVMHPFGGSDMTQYQVLHGVNWSFISPETIAGELFLLFNK